MERHGHFESRNCQRTREGEWTRQTEKERGERNDIVSWGDDFIPRLSSGIIRFDVVWFLRLQRWWFFFSLSIRAIYSIYKLCCCPAAMSGLLIVFHSHWQTAKWPPSSPNDLSWQTVCVDEWSLARSDENQFSSHILWPLSSKHWEFILWSSVDLTALCGWHRIEGFERIVTEIDWQQADNQSIFLLLPDEWISPLPAGILSKWHMRHR